MRDARGARRFGSPALSFPLALVIAGLLVGCSDDDPESDATTTTTDAVTTTASTTTEPPETTTTEAVSEEGAVLAAVDGFWQVLLDSSAPPNPDHPDLERYLTGAQLETSRGLIAERLQLGQAVRLPDGSVYADESTVDSIDGDNAIVSDCGVDDGVLYDRASGTVLNDEVSTRLWRLRLVQTADEWKVAGSDVIERWDGVAGCADN